MRTLMLIAAVIALSAARPELYREKEDFQFSRSSTDEGSKSGYYGAQRGNMGGNYERAHNMDGVAQHQMSGLVHQTEGELGDAAKMRTGSVYAAANSRGTYGSGRYNLNNLEGRNFEEGVSYDSSQSQSSQKNSAVRQNSSGSNRYSNSYSHSSGQSSSQQSEHQGHEIQSSNLQDDSYRQQEYSGYNDRSGFSHIFYPQIRLVNTRPVRIMVRPGTRVSVPVATQTYNTDQRASTYDSASYEHNAAKSDYAQTHNADRRGSSYDSSSYGHNAAKSDAEVIINNDQETNSRYPNNPKNKHYEQSYSYQKEWEKHDTNSEVTPLSIPTESTLHAGSQRYDNSQGYNTRHHYQRSGADSQNDQYNSNIKTASTSQGRYRSNQNSQQESLSSTSNSNAHTHAAHHSEIDNDYMRQLANTQISNTNSMPHSYQSSYSYHKSWERQGDPYVIEPASSGSRNGQASQRMTSNGQDAHSSHHYDSQHKQSSQSYSYGNGLDSDCDDERHIRVARSYNINNEFDAQQQNQELEQSHNGWEDLGQQTQEQWANLEHRSPGIHSEDKWNNLEDLGQQTQNGWDKVEDLGQQTQNSWDKIEDFGQQSQNKRDKIEDLGQQTQNSWDKTEDLEQQTQTKWDKNEDLVQQTQNGNSWDKVGKDLEQQTQTKWDKNTNLNQQSQNSWDKVEDLGQQTQTNWDNFEDLDQQSQNNRDKTEELGPQKYNKWNIRKQKHDTEDLSQQSQTQWHQLNKGQESQSNTDQQTWDQSTQSDIHTNSNNFGPGLSDQQFEGNWDLVVQASRNPESFKSQNTNEQETITNNDNSRTTQNEILDLKKAKNSTNLWDKIDTFESVQNSQYHSRETLDSKLNKPRDLNQNTGFYDQNTNTDWNINNKYHIIPSSTYNKTQQQNSNKQYYGNSQLDSTYSSNSWYDSSLNSFWDKINSFEQESAILNVNGVENGSDSERNNYKPSNQDVYYQNHNKLHSTHGTNPDNIISTANIDKQLNNSYSEIMTTTIKAKLDENIVSHTRDVGRGDIGAEDFETESISTTTENSHIWSDFNTLDKNINKYKTPEQIEALSLTKDNNVSGTAMLGSLNKTIDATDISEPIELSNQADQKTESNSFEGEQSPDEINQKLHDQEQHNKYSQDVQSPPENLGENFENIRQHSQNLDQQHMAQNFEDFEQHNQDEQQQQNIEQNLEDFGQHSQELIQQNMEQNLEQFGQHNQELHQQNMEQNLEDFGQRIQDLNQQNIEDFKQHRQDLYLQNLGKQSKDLSRQNAENLREHNQEINEQNSEEFGQLSQDLSHLNLGTFGQHSEDYQNLNMNQNFEYIRWNHFNEKNGEVDDFQDMHKIENINKDDIVQHQENKDLVVENIPTENKFVDLRDRYLNHYEIPQNQAQRLQNINNPKSYSFDNNKQDDSLTTGNLKPDTQLVQEHNVSSTTVAPITEKPGFWASVGNKLSRAKNKVSSWFRSS